MKETILKHFITYFMILCSIKNLHALTPQVIEAELKKHPLYQSTKSMRVKEYFKARYLGLNTYLQKNMKADEEFVSQQFMACLKSTMTMLNDFFNLKQIDLKNDDIVIDGIEYAINVLVSQLNLNFTNNPSRPIFQFPIHQAGLNHEQAAHLYDNPHTYYHTLVLRDIPLKEVDLLVEGEIDPSEGIENQTLFWNVNLYTKKGTSTHISDHKLGFKEKDTRFQFIITSNPKALKAHELYHGLPIVKANGNEESLIVRQYNKSRSKKIPMRLRAQVIGSISSPHKDPLLKTSNDIRYALDFVRRVLRDASWAQIVYRPFINQKFVHIKGDFLYPTKDNFYTAASVTDLNPDESFQVIVKGDILEFQRKTNCRYYSLTLHDPYQRTIFHTTLDQVRPSQKDSHKAVLTVTRSYPKMDHRLNSINSQNQFYTGHHSNVSLLVRHLDCKVPPTNLKFEIKRKGPRQSNCIYFCQQGWSTAHQLYQYNNSCLAGQKMIEI